MMVINGAYRILKNPALRILYDKQRIRGLYGIKSGITERSDTSGASSSSSSSSTTAPPKQQPKPQQPKSRPRSSNEDTNSAGFGGSWSTNDDAYNRDRERERDLERERQAQYEESPYRRAERIRQERDREWEEAGGQPQPQRQRVDGYSDDFGFTVPPSSSSRSSNSRSDEPIRSSERHHGSNALDEVEEFLRSTGSRVSNELESLIVSMKSKLAKLRLRKTELERSVYSDTRDWGEVTDKHAIKQRLMDITEIKMLNQQVSEMEEEIADIMLRGRTTGGNSNPVGSTSRVSRPAVDLWGEQTTGTRPREQSPYRGGSGNVNRPPPPPPPRKRRPLDSENWDKYFEEDEWGFRGAGSSSSGINDLDKAMWRNRRGGSNHRGGSGGGGGGGRGGGGGGGGVGEGGNQRASMSGGDIGNVGAVNIGGKLFRDDETEANDSSDVSVEIHNDPIDTKTIDTLTDEMNLAEKEYHAIHPNIGYDEICRLFRKHVLRSSI